VLALDKYHTQEPIETVYELTERAKGLADQVTKAEDTVTKSMRQSETIVDKGYDIAHEVANRALIRTDKRVKQIDGKGSHYNEDRHLAHGVMRCLGCKKALRPIYVDDNRKEFFFSENKDAKIYWGKVVCECGKEREFVPSNITVRRAAVVKRTERI
jgi:hypothetical protein